MVGIMKSSREQFEGWVISYFPEGERRYSLMRHFVCNDEYKIPLVQSSWIAWQASRAAMSKEEVTTAPFLKVD